MTGIGPLLLSPRLDAKPWGSRRLERFGFHLPSGESIGEAVITASEAVISNGDFTGRTLGDLIADDPQTTIGERGLVATRGLPVFPLLIKLIDASDVLSIQVHPSNANAPAGSLGKTEAWHVLAAEPGAVLYLGLKSGVDVGDLDRLARAGRTTAHLMRKVPAVVGMTVLLPAGTVHALGAGLLVYEIQQNSAITYRLDDWGRVDANGRGRQLHIELGLTAIDPTSRPEPLTAAPLPAAIGRRTRLARCRYFAAERVELPAGATVAFDGEGAPQVFTCLAGRLTATAEGGSISFGAGETVAVLAGAKSAGLEACKDALLIRGWLDPAG